ncbi:MAG: SDR family oxidoreductase, partial [Anaerolineales bacterium]
DAFFADVAQNEVPLQRIGTPEDIAYAALYLASQMSSFVPGQTINVSGVLRQVAEIHTHPAAILQNRTARLITGCLQDHLQAAFLPSPPDIGWFAAQRGFFHIPPHGA